MPKSTLAGHPAHPILITVPVGLLPFSLAMDVAYLATGKKKYAQASYFAMVGGVVGGLVAAATGAADYLSIPCGTAAKKTANLHALLNVWLIALSSYNLLSRRGKWVPSSKGQTAMSAVGVGALLVSSWYGGTLVYDHGMRVQGVDPIGHAPEVKLPGDEALEQSLRKFEEAVTPQAEGTGQLRERVS
jgi:uncharacterized membrane protein